jgi:hypothetical protein
MKKMMIVGVAAAMLLAGGAMAQTATSGAAAGSNSTSGATSGSVSGAVTGPSNSASGAAAQTGASQATTGGSTANLGLTQNSTNINPADVTIRSAPALGNIGIVTGNVCAISAAAGGSFIGTGIMLGASWESMMCETRHRAALMANMGDQSAAKELMCGSDKAIYDAYKTAGRPCAFRADWEPKGTTPVASQLPAGPQIAAPAPQPMPSRTFNAKAFSNVTDCLNGSVSADERNACSTAFTTRASLALRATN